MKGRVESLSLRLTGNVIIMSGSCRLVLYMMLSFYSLLSKVISATMRELVRQQE